MQETITYVLRPCAYGLALAAFGTRGLCALFLGEKETQLEAALTAQFPAAHLAQTLDAKAMGAVMSLLDGKSFESPLTLDMQGTPFQKKVWRALCAIPRGETRSYSAIAKQIGTPKAVRAVGRACGANTLAIIVPCHRVLAADGKISGYRWGTARKRKILRDEGIAV